MEVVPGAALEVVPGAAVEVVPGAAVEVVPGASLELPVEVVPGSPVVPAVDSGNLVGMVILVDFCADCCDRCTSEERGCCICCCDNEG